LCGYCKCSHIDEYAALSKTPLALADGLMLVFQHPVRSAHRRPIQPIDDTNDKKVALKLQWISGAMPCAGRSPSLDRIGPAGSGGRIMLEFS
jgi:hypothetical protein